MHGRVYGTIFYALDYRSDLRFSSQIMLRRKKPFLCEKAKLLSIASPREETPTISRSSSVTTNYKHRQVSKHFQLRLHHHPARQNLNKPSRHGGSNASVHFKLKLPDDVQLSFVVPSSSSFRSFPLRGRETAEFRLLLI